MKKTQINKEHKYLIQSVIKENPKFEGNEELLELILEAAYKKSYLIIDAIRDVDRLKRHLAVICDNCIEQIVKEKQKYNSFLSKSSFNQEAEEIVSVRKTPFMQKEETKRELLDASKKQEVVILKEEIQRSEKYDAVDMLIDPLDFCPRKRISEHTLDRLIQIIKDIEEQFPNKRYFEIFNLRYIKKYNQTDTASEMKISQVELSKRFVEMIKLVREQL